MQQRNQGIMKSLLPWLVAFTAITLSTAILVFPAQWASSGTMIIPVKVVVFDAHSLTPIGGAFAVIVRAPLATSEFGLNEYRDQIPTGLSTIEEFGTETNRDGVAILRQEFRTGANHDRPISHAHTSWYWLLVSAEGYGKVAVPLRYESVPTTQLKDKGQLSASVGMTRVDPE